MLIATAGHVDHGKTSLIKALTGVDTDRLPEEKKRGLTIDLGFAYQTLAQGQSLSFVDVPGHERFIRNMVAGVPAIDLVLLVIAADDGVMPQTKEHLAIVSLLGVKQAVVAISKVDLVEDERFQQVKLEALSLLADFGFENVLVFPFSSKTGVGISEIAEFLRRQVQQFVHSASTGFFRLAIDRSFSVTGAGVVVTGTVFSGSVSQGSNLMLSPSQRSVRVRSIEWQGQTITSIGAGERCALNIAGTGINAATIKRGDWLVDPALDLVTDCLDVRVQLLASESRPLKHWTPVHIHAGASALTGRVALVEGRELSPGQTALAQLLIEQPITLLYGDRFVLRDQSARRTLGGGYVINPLAERRGRSKPVRVQLLQAIDTENTKQALTVLLDKASHGVGIEDFTKSRNIPAQDQQALLQQIDSVALSTNGRSLLIAVGRWQRLYAYIINTLQNWHQQKPELIGLKQLQLRQMMAVAAPPVESTIVFTAALHKLVNDGEIVREGVFLRLPEHSVQLSETDQQLYQQVMQFLQPDQLKPPALRDLLELTQLDNDILKTFLQRAVGTGLLVQVAATRYFHPQAIAHLANICEHLGLQATQGHFTVRDFCDASGLGRNAAVQVLEYFDGIGFTRRLQNNRYLNPSRIKQ